MSLEIKPLAALYPRRRPPPHTKNVLYWAAINLDHFYCNSLKNIYVGGEGGAYYTDRGLLLKDIAI